MFCNKNGNAFLDSSSKMVHIHVSKNKNSFCWGPVFL